VLRSQNHGDEALAILEHEVLPLHETLRDVGGQSVTLADIAEVLTEQGKTEEALALLRDRLLPMQVRVHDDARRAHTLEQIAAIHEARGELDEAKQGYTDALALYRRFDHKPLMAGALHALAHIAEQRGDLDDAVRIRRDEILPLVEPIGGRELQSHLSALGELLRRRDVGEDRVEAARYLLLAATLTP
jgi:tetratricopeptide (TPR) repeat protein